jgi:hypothetical protein
VPPGRTPFDYVTPMPLSQLVLLADPLRPEDKSAFQGWVETGFAIGLVPLGCTVVALLDRTRRALVVAFAAMGFVAFGIATADEPFFTLARALPGVMAGDLRRLLFAVFVCLVVLAGLGADVLLRGERRRVLVAALTTVATASLLVLGWLAMHRDDAAFARGLVELYVADADHPDVVQHGGSVDAVLPKVNAALQPGELEHNRTMLVTTALRALLVAGLAVAAAWLRPPWRLAVWLTVTIGELLHAGLGPVQTVAAERVTRVPAVLQPVADARAPGGVRPRLQRLLPADAKNNAGLPGNLPGFLGLEDAGAYNPLPPRRADEFFDAIDEKAGSGGVGIGAFRDTGALTHPLCDLFGIRFVMTREARETLPATATLLDRTPPDTGGYRLLERTTTLPRATFVRNVDVIPDAKARRAALAARDRDVAHRVVLEDAAAPVPSGPDGDATVTITAHTDERVVVRVDATTDGYVRLADPWDAGWCATVDGVAAHVRVADHFLRAVHVTAGAHEIVFTYDGPRAVWPLRLTLLGWVVVGALLWLGRRRA